MLNLVTHTYISDATSLQSNLSYNMSPKPLLYIYIYLLHTNAIICRLEFIFWQPHLTVATYYYDYCNERVVSECEFPLTAQCHREQSFQIAFQSLCFLSEYPYIHIYNGVG